MSLQDRIAQIKRAPEDAIGKVSAGVASRFLDRWMEMTRETGKPCEDPSQIDYDDPRIHVERLLCDPANIVRLQSKRMRGKFLAELTPEERDYLLNSNPEEYENFQHHKLKTMLKNRKSR